MRLGPIHGSVAVGALLVLLAGPMAEAADAGSTRSATSSTSSYLGSTQLPAPVLSLTQKRLSSRSTEYTVQGRSVDVLAHRVSTTTVCEYLRPGRLTDLRVLYEVTSESLVQADPDAGITFTIDYAFAPSGPWRRLPIGSFGLRYDGTLDPLLRRTIGVDGLLTTAAGERARRLYLRVRSTARLEGNVASFSDTLRVDC